MKIRLSVRQKILSLIGLFLIVFLEMLYFAHDISSKDRELGLTHIREVMLEGHKEKIKVAIHSVAASLSTELEEIDDEEKQVEIMRSRIRDIRFEKDKSGYFMVFKGTTCLILPPNKSLEGKDLRDLKDSNGVYIVRGLSQGAGNGGGFTEYVFAKPGKGEQPKIISE